MLNLMKWDLRNIWENTKIFNVIIGMLLILSIIFPQALINRFLPNFSDLNYIWPIVVSVILFTYIFIGIIYLVIKMVLDIRKNEMYLIVDRSSSQIIISKVFVNIILAFILLSIGIVGSYILQRFATDSYSFLTLTFNAHPLMMILSIVGAGLVLLLAYMISKSFNFTRNNAFIWTIIFLAIIAFGENIVDTLIQVFCGMRMYFVQWGIQFNTDNMNVGLYNNLHMVFNGILILLYTYICCNLLEKRFQR